MHSAAPLDLAATYLFPIGTKFCFVAYTDAQTTVRVRALKAFFRVYYLWIRNPTVCVKWNSSLPTPRTNSSLSKLSDPSECGVWIGTQDRCKSFDPCFLLSLKLLEALRKLGKDLWKCSINFCSVYYCVSISKEKLLIGSLF